MRLIYYLAISRVVETTPKKESTLYKNVVLFCFDNAFLYVFDISSCLTNISSFFEIICNRSSFCFSWLLIILSFKTTSLLVKTKLLLTNFISALQTSPLTRSLAINLATVVSITTLLSCFFGTVVFFGVTVCEILLPHTSRIRLKRIFFIFFILL